MLLLQDIPEKQPAILSLIYTAGFALMVIWLGVSLVRRMRRRRSALAGVAPADLPEEVRKRLGVTSTNRGLHAVRFIFIALALTVFGFHVYWARYASEKNERFQQLAYKDLRNRRLQESTLRGWILDRTGKLENALALYRRAPNGQIFRDYPLDAALAQLFGSDRGDPGLERALFGIQGGAVPEAFDVAMERDVKLPENLDVQLTIHGELQKAVVEQLRDRHGAAVVINPQTGDVLAMYSNPSYSLKEAQDEATYIRLEANDRDKPLVNRALGAYYIPGSTFKTVTMIAAFNAGMQDTEFVCSGSGYVASPGSKPIFDAGGTGEVHGRIGIGVAYEVSCNQYFGQMAVKLGPERMAESSRLLGITPYPDTTEAVRGRKQPQIWNVSSPALARALAPREATIVAYPKMRAFDLALIGYGQGYSGQMTPFEMALTAASIANLEGKLMKPKIEFNQPPAVFAQAMSPQHAAEMRRIMAFVTSGGSGTARGVFAPITAAGISTGGKTGTAEKEVPVYDPKTGEPKTVKKTEKDRRGNVIREYEQLVLSPEMRIDSWFLCIAPLERPQLAIAVIIEGGGYGSRAAAPVAAALVLKARELELLGLPPVAAPPTSSPSGQPQQRTAPSPRATPRPRRPPEQTAQR